MSKTKSLKNKTTGFDIVYRVVTAILAVAIYPLFYFLDLLYIQMDHKAIADLWGQITENSKPELGITYEYLSLSKSSELVDLIKTFMGDESASFDLLRHAVYRPLIAAIVFLAIALVIGLVILGFAIFSNKVKVVACLSAGGFLSSVISFFCFSEGFAAPIIDGRVQLAELFGQSASGGVSFVLQMVGDITYLSLQGAFFAVLFIMLAILIWSGSVLLVNISDEKEHTAKKAAKAR